MTKKTKRMLIVIAVIIAALLITAKIYYCWTPLQLVTLVAELLIPFVIYYEIEEMRASGFVSKASGAAYGHRALLYREFVKAPGKNLSERAVSFRQMIEGNKRLRAASEAQLIYFAKFHYLLRWSLFHRDLMIIWFPHVVVKVWIMLNQYIERHEKIPVGYQSLMTAVLRSLEYLEEERIALNPFYSFETNEEVAISPEELAELKASLKRRLGKLSKPGLP